MKAHTMRNKFEAFNKEFSKQTRIMDCEDPMLKSWGHDLKEWERLKGVYPWHGEEKYLEKCHYIDRINGDMRASIAPHMTEEASAWHIQFWTKEGHVITTFCSLDDGVKMRMTAAYEEVLEELGIEIRHIARCAV